MIYHYTKGYTLKSIFTDGFIATEGKRGLSRSPKFTDLVWLTSQKVFPKTALPSISTIPSSSLALHYSVKNVAVDYDAIAESCEGLFRFGFTTDDRRIKRWWHSDERSQMLNNPFWRHMESLANKVGDEVRQFWISTGDLELRNFVLERLESGRWVTVINSLDGDSLEQSNEVIEALCANAERWADQFGLSQSDFRLAA